MKILFHSLVPLRSDLGATKVLIEVGQALTRLGCECEFIDPKGMGNELGFSGTDGLHRYQIAVRDHLVRHAAEFDAVEFDQAALPFPRQMFAPETLLVARSVLLTLHFSKIRFPRIQHWKHGLSHLLGSYTGKARQRRIEAEVLLTFQNADLINVANHDDVKELASRGIDGGKVAVFHYGLKEELNVALQKLASPRLEKPVVCFIGTFDARKGGGDMPAIFERIRKLVPGVRFLLLGAKGLLQTEEDVLGCFPANLRDSIRVVPAYSAAELPSLLKEATIGIFPSYVEGFGFAILEMMAAGMPVVAYQAPGPPEMLTKEFLVPAGGRKELAQKVADLLLNEPLFRSASSWARKRVENFNWQQIAVKTLARYESEKIKLKGR